MGPRRVLKPDWATRLDAGCERAARVFLCVINPLRFFVELRGFSRGLGRIETRARGPAGSGWPEMRDRYGMTLQYKRLMLKLSGEALMGSSGYGFDVSVASRLANDVHEAVEGGAQIAVTVGGGNIFRGLAGAASGMDRATADYMGMLATVMNALAFANVLGRTGTPSRVLSAIPMPTVCESYVRPKALHHISEGRVVIFAAGTGNPYFTTDTTAALRAIETDCEAVVKATQVDGVYSADPKTNPDAERYDRLSYSEVLARDLKVMDGAAIALARENNLPVVVCSIKEPGNLLKVLRGDAHATVIGPEGA